MSGPYDDIIYLPHHVSEKHPQMSQENRAAQFSPFAALTGHGAAIQETARLTNERIEPSENMIADLDRKLRELNDKISEHPEIVVTYFQADEKKNGGTYVTISGALKKVDNYEGTIVLMDNKKIAIQDILDVQSEILSASD